jgi:WD40 repeat protein
VIRLWHVVESPDGEQRLELADDEEPLRGHTGAVNCLAVQPHGGLLASGGLDGTVRLWELEARRPVGEPMAAEARLSDLAFSPDGRTLASAALDGSVRLWDVETRRQLGRPLGAHARSAGGVAFDPDGTALMTGGEQPGLRRWDSLLWTDDRKLAHARLCSVVGRNLTRAEWAEFLPEEDYRETCSG